MACYAAVAEVYLKLTFRLASLAFRCRLQRDVPTVRQYVIWAKLPDTGPIQVGGIRVSQDREVGV